MSKIGIFGGTFNPIHNGHINLLNQMINSLNLDKAIVIPTNLPPHKKVSNLSNFDDRFNMCKLAFNNYKNVEVSDIEHKISGASYTFNTLSYLKDKYSGDSLYLIIGSDMALDFNSWYKYKDILQMVKVVTAARDKTEYKRLKEDINIIKNNIEVLKIDEYNISSTAIRIMVSQNIDCKKFLHDKVNNYIIDNGLYSGKKCLLSECDELAQKMLTKKRYEHSKNVQKAAIELAKIYECDEYKISIAAILHDIMKNKTDGELLNFFNKHDIVLNKNELKSPSTWHSKAGYIFLKDELNIKDQQILNSVLYHTTAKRGMSEFEKIIYVADYISKDRMFKGVKSARKLAKRDLDLAMLHSLRNVLYNLSSSCKPIHSNSFECYDELVVDKNLTIKEDYFEN